MMDGARALQIKLQHFIELDAFDIIALRNWLCRASETYYRGNNLIVEGNAFSQGFVLLDGWAVSYKTLPDGSRQILSFLMPGDIVGLFAPVASISTETVTALGPLKVAPFAFDEILNLAAQAPRVGVGLGWIAAREREILAEHLVSVGRRSATGRVAHLFLEFWARLRIRGIVTAPIFTVPVTQADVADALGLSVVHVNRTIKYLRHCGAIECHRHRIRILEIDALQEIAGFSEEFLLNHYAPGPIRHRVENLVAKFADTLGDGGEAYVQHTE